MERPFDTTLKITVTVVCIGATVTAKFVGTPDLSSTAAVSISLVGGLSMMLWGFIGFIRDDEPGPSMREALAALSLTDRRLVKRARRQPDGVPDRLAEIAARHAQRQAQSTRWSGWNVAGALLTNSPTFARAEAVTPLMFLVMVGLVGTVGLSIYLDQQWGRTTEVMLERAERRVRAADTDA